MNRAEVAVVGAGIAGLTCATELLDGGLDDVVVLEAAERVGGPAESVRIGDWLVERGPNTVRGSDLLDALFARVGLAKVAARSAAPWAVSGGELVRVPPSLRGILRGELLGRGGWLELLAEPFRRVEPGPRSVQAFVRERLGPTAAARLADLLTLGSQGTTADRVGFESAFPDLAAELERAGGRLSRLALRRLRARGEGAATRHGIVSTDQGLGALPQRLGERLGERVRLRAPVRALEMRDGGYELLYGADGAEHKLSCRRVVLAVPPAAAASALDLAPERELLEAWRTTPQTLASFALADAACAERWQGLGFLVPQRERLPLIGCLFPSALFPGRGPSDQMLLSVFVGPTLRNASDVALVRDLAPVLKRLLGALREPELLDVARYPEGIPLYDPEHSARVAKLRAALAERPGLHVAGWGYDGAGFGAAAASGRDAARRVLAS